MCPHYRTCMCIDVVVCMLHVTKQHVLFKDGHLPSCTTSHTQAARYQVLIAFAAMASSSLAVLLVTVLATAALLDAHAMLRGDKLVDRGDRKAGIEPWLHAQLSKVW